ncbi:response regulator [Dictyobacter kobayashii]|uniref:Response regulator n=1 Tax=Dictyobacter kobayashii TaxID=2014872 RepID=A0A402AUG2_9CHLR|nr:response regulator [Dictyobacter kobayashii]GCE22727.1 response regulator [Dictyobacter kobayashii]
MQSEMGSPVMIIEDNNYDFEILQWAFSKLATHTPLLHFKNGEQALAFLQSSNDFLSPSPTPSVILLDLTLQDMDGQEILGIIKRDEKLKKIPVIIWTSSANDERIAACFQLGANSYMIKPTKRENFLQSAKFLQSYWSKTQNETSIYQP